MKLRNKETGEIGNLKSFNNDKRVCVWINKETDLDYIYNSLAELNEKWEDYEEPKKTWFIDTYGSVRDREAMTLVVGWDNKPIFEFETKEEAERAAEKLKAWTRLEDKGFRFTDWKNGIFLDGTIAGQVRYEFPIDNKDDIEKDLDLLFGGEE